MLDRVDPALGKSTYSDHRYLSQGGESPGGQQRADPIRVYLACADQRARHGLSLLLSNSQDIDVVGQAGDGGQAIETAAELQPDTVLVDIDLPGRLESQASRELVRVCPGTSIMVLTSSARDELLAAPSMRGVAAGQGSDGLLTAIRTLRSGEIMVYPPW